MVIVFDLDDTLYPERDFVKSGFWAVALRLTPDSPAATYRQLMRILAAQGSGQVFNVYAEQHGSPVDIAELVDLYRYHQPWIALDVEARIVLETVRRQCPTALITDGPHRMQQNKFQALGLASLIDLPIFTDLMGTSKPDPRPYQTVMERFGPEETYTYIADNPRKDFIAPQQLGWHTIRLKRPGGVYAEVPAVVDHEVHQLLDVLDVLPPVPICREELP